MSSDPIAAVFFDFAGTLFSDRDLRDVHLRQLQFVASAAGVDAPDRDLRVAYRQGMGSAYRTYATQPSYLHRDFFSSAFRAMAAGLGGEISDAAAQEAVSRQHRATIEHAVLRPDALETLTALRRAGIHVQVVSNIDDEQLVPMLDRLGLWDAIDAATSSESAGSCKPDPAYYRLAMGKAGVEASQSLFVGDSLGHDVFGPSLLGMRTAWLVPDGARADPGDIRPDCVIATLGDVLEIAGVEVDQ